MVIHLLRERLSTGKAITRCGVEAPSRLIQAAIWASIVNCPACLRKMEAKEW